MNVKLPKHLLVSKNYLHPRSGCFIHNVIQVPKVMKNHLFTGHRPQGFFSTRISGRYAPFIVAPPGGYGGHLVQHCGHLAQSQQH